MLYTPAKLGRVQVAYNLMESEEARKEVAAAFGITQFVPLLIDYDLVTQTLTYTGTSPFFRELNECEIAPVYRLTIVKDDDGVGDAHLEEA